MKMKYNFLIIVLISLPSFAQITPEQMVEQMGRGINLGNVLSATVEGNWAPAVEQQYFLDVAEAGFTTVRLPMDFFGSRTSGSTESYSKEAGTAGSYIGSIADYTVSISYLNRIEQIVNWALDAGLITIIDLHGSTLKTEFLYTFDRKNRHPDLRTDPTSAKRLADLDKFTAIWMGIANRFKNKTENLLFEIINEPYFEVNEEDMNALNSSMISSIRNTGANNLTRNIIITGGLKNAEEAPTTIDPAILSSDDYLIATFHYYKPNDFTKSTQDDKNQNTFGSIADKNLIKEHFESVLVWSNTNNTPILMGEFGADNTLGYNYSTGDLQTISSNATGFANGGPENDSRVEYYRYLAEQAINRGFAFTVWDAGPESGKTIHKRQDAPTTKNYDINYFSVQSYSPKNTIKSTVEDTSIWVEDIKNALFTSGEWPLAVSDQKTENLELKVYPNPGRGQINIKSTRRINKIDIYSTLGILVSKKIQIDDRIDVHDLSNGLYYLKIFLENGSIVSKKILIENKISQAQ
jgi:endoglucanase